MREDRNLRGWGWVGVALPVLGVLVHLACNTAVTGPLPSAPVEGPDTGAPVNTATPRPFAFGLRIARDSELPISDDRVDAIFAEASSILQSVEFDCFDVATPVAFEREGEVNTFETRSSIVSTEAQLDNIFDYPADFKIVALMVGVCGATGPADMSVILGCAYTGGSVVIAHNAPADVWAHEWGHVQGLPHRNDCETNLMHAFELQTNAVNEAERNAFLTPTPRRSILKQIPLADGARDDGPVWSGEVRIEEWLEDAVSRRYISGLPRNMVLAEPEVPVAESLVGILERGPSAPQLINVIRGLGLAGDPLAVPVLIGWLDQLEGALSTDEVAAAAEAFLALGRLSAVDPSGVAIQFLVDGVSPAAWQTRGLLLQTDSGHQERLEEVWARFSIMSLGVSEHPLAAERLLELRAQMAAGRLSGAWLAEQVDEAIARGQGDPRLLREGPWAARMP